MHEDFFMHDLFKKETGKDFRAEKTPEDIQQLFRGLGYENIAPEISNRLSFLSVAIDRRNSHFQDALEISEIIDNLLPEELDERQTNELRMASLVHDVGKSGPAEANPEEQVAFVEIFNLDFPYGELVDGLSVNEMPLEKALLFKVASGELTEGRAEELIELIEVASQRQAVRSVDTKISRKTPMGSVWSAHSYWTYAILQKAEMPETLVETAASHHLLEGHDPARVGLENITSSIASLEVADKYQAYRVRLIVADKYQAYRKRSGKTHDETLVIMRERIEERFEGYSGDAGDTKKMYLDVLDKLDKNKELFQKELDLKEEE